MTKSVLIKVQDKIAMTRSNFNLAEPEYSKAILDKTNQHLQSQTEVK